MLHQCRIGFSSSFLSSMRSSILDDCFTDDSAFIAIANALIRARIVNKTQKKSFSSLVKLFPVDTPQRLLARMWLGTRVQSAAEVVSLARDTYDAWQNNYPVGRVVGSLYSLVLTDCDTKSAYEALINRSLNRACRTVHSFLRGLLEDNKNIVAILPTLKAPNPSLPLRITHPKVMMINCCINNDDFGRRRSNELISRHPSIKSDYAYREMLRL